MREAKSVVFIIDDNLAVCQALKCLLEASLDYSIATYNSAKSFLNNYGANLHGCVIVDVLMPDMNGFELLHELRKRGNQMPVIMLTGHGDIPMAVQAIQAGAKDFITKPFNPASLLQKIQTILDEYNKASQHLQVLQARYSQLTPREREVMQHMLTGKLNKQIAAELNIAQKTVELHRFNIMHKLEAKTLADLIHNYLFIINKEASTCAPIS